MALDFSYSSDQETLRQYVRDWVNRNCPQDLMYQLDTAAAFPTELYAKMGEAGLCGIAIPEEYGGTGGDIVTQTIVIEELARRLAGVCWLWGLSSCFGGHAVGHYGTPAQKERFLPALARGEITFAISITEPNGGTDVLGAMRTTATDKGDHWEVNGSKVWTSGAAHADYLLVVARSKPTSELTRKSDGITIMFVERGAPGLTIREIPKLGMKALPSCEVFYDGVVVPKENVLGETHGGWKLLLSTLNNERILGGGTCCGILAGVLEETVAYAQERTAFGKQIGAFQALQHYMADMKIGLDFSRLLTYKAAWMQSKGMECGVEATEAKIVASEQAFLGADRGMQILGGYGYALEYPLQRYMRDARLFRIAPISNEMGRNFIGQSLGLPRSY